MRLRGAPAQPARRVEHEGAGRLEVADEAALSRRPCVSIHETYGMFPKNVMSGLRRVVARVRDGPAAVERARSGRRRRAARRRSRGGRRRRPRPRRPTARSGRAGVERAGGDARVLGVAGRRLVQRAGVLGRGRGRARAEAVARPTCRARLIWPAVPLPTACQWKPPSARRVRDDLAPRRPARCRAGRGALGSVSYQTVQATVSVGPVNAMSGSMPLRLGSTFSVGSPVADEPPFSREPVEADLLPAEDAHARGGGRLEAGAGLRRAPPA